MQPDVEGVQYRTEERNREIDLKVTNGIEAERRDARPRTDPELTHERLGETLHASAHIAVRPFPICSDRTTRR